MSTEKFFTLRLIFTGICSLVTEKPLSASGGPKELYLVLVDGWAEQRDTGMQGIDGYDNLMRHGAMIQFPLKNLGSAAAPASARGVWYLKRHRLDFDFVEKTTGSNPFWVNSTLANHVADMTKIAPAYSVGSVVIGAQPPDGILANSTQITKGALDIDTTVTAGTWRFAPTLAPKAIKVTAMAYRIILTLNDLKKMTLTATPFNVGSPRAGNPGSGLDEQLEIVATQDGETVDVVIANACDNNPLIWKVNPAVELIKKDLDFKWHYEILPAAIKAQINTDLDGKELPFPIYAGTDMGQGRNCFPAFFTI